MKKKNALKEMWQDPKGKAILKFGLWGFFFIFLILIMAVTKLTGPSTLPIIETKEPEEKEPITFLTLEEMWEKLQEDHSYHYELKNNETNEIITYSGTITNQIDTGYRESKLGIIHYKIEEGNQYQLTMEEEEPIDNLYEEEDAPYLNLAILKEKIIGKEYEEKIYIETKTLTITNEEETILVNMETDKITSIQINTAKKQYFLRLG